ncbi:hypothetical protein [Deinococcus maricopensis]|uniref:Uncharacterized protein n=1 Tax=Deinococcus maricopensis (strain DSM 21211 / LMG 22137 / NRRL B-23946 / LB-34) TaxID=709986 RepID=E8UA01_DEIML|nr:hypothetical protein [Deinococcus maricopensis]ADV67890.1 hypothetical protein Deima_2252 [Deinococcus maricopensis DSM 21211]
MIGAFLMVLGVVGVVGAVFARQQAHLSRAVQDLGEGPRGSGPHVGPNIPGPY